MALALGSAWRPRWRRLDGLARQVPAPDVGVAPVASMPAWSIAPVMLTAAAVRVLVALETEAAAHVLAMRPSLRAEGGVGNALLADPQHGARRLDGGPACGINNIGSITGVLRPTVAKQ